MRRAVVVVFLLAVFTTRANSHGVLIGAAASIGVLFYVTQFTDTHFYVYPIVGIGTAVLVGYVASIVVDGPRQVAGLTWHTRDAEPDA